MNYTPNYHLPTWAMTDRIQMEDFNDMTAQLETALTAEAAARQSGDDTLTAAVAKCGNCSVGLTTYTGRGGNGKTSPTVISFPRKPFAFLAAGFGGCMVGWGSKTTAYTGDGAEGYVTWSGSQCSVWMNCSEDYQQLNEKGERYYVLAFYAES